MQSMTITKTADVEGTLQQIYALAAAGCDIVRCTCNEIEAAEGLAQIVPRSPVPIIADIHHQYKMALAAMEAGVHGLRLNPGNIRRPEHIKAVASEAKDRGIPIRIGVNGGSLDPELYDKYGGKVTPEAMVESAMREIAYFDEVGFDQIKISVKASNVPLMVEAYRQLSEVTDHPLHLGVTEAGPLPNGLLKATAGIAALLLEGIGDTIRVSLTPEPGGDRTKEVVVGQEILQTMGLRKFTPMVIACPGCGRTTSTYFQQLAQDIQSYLRHRMPEWRRTHTGVEEMNVAVMGCVVNGPGESKHANIGISLPGTGERPVAPVYEDGEKTVTLKGEYKRVDTSQGDESTGVFKANGQQSYDNAAYQQTNGLFGAPLGTHDADIFSVGVDFIF